MKQLGNDSTAQVLNFPDLLARVDNDRDLLSELLGLFKQESSDLLVSLKQAVVHEDMKGVETTAHTLKGMLANLSATRGTTAAAHLEAIGRSSEKSQLKAALTAFESEMAILLPSIDVYLHGVEG